MAKIFETRWSSSRTTPPPTRASSPVLRYLEEFARQFDPLGLVRFGTEVVSVRRSRDDDAGWRVRLACAGSELEEEV